MKEEYLTVEEAVREIRETMYANEKVTQELQTENKDPS
jgi:hypothetical protein